MASSSSSSSPEISHAPAAVDPSFFSYASLDDVLEELSTRFIMNLPDQELESVERMCFQVEQAHWYYEDFMREANPRLPSLSLKKFSSIFFNSCPLLRQWSAEHEQYFNTFMHYKVRVPVCGAIMLNDKWDKCILVKGWKSSAGWGFPKGKINQNEPAHECAAREVGEETGFNISSLIKPQDCIEMTIREQRVTLFIVSGVPEDYPFQTRTRKEISKIEWFKLSDLPSWKRNKQVPGKFYLISPFVHPLREFIRVNKPTKRRPNRCKNGGETGADLAIEARLERDAGDEAGEEHQQLSLRAVSLDRDVHGYSSSSADNGEPQTPSPQSTEALPVTTELDAEGKPDVSMDPHFARLLNGLTLSASKPTLKGEADPRPTSITPTSAKSSVASAAGKESNASQTPNVNDVEGASPQVLVKPSVTSCSSPLGVKSPADSYRSDRSVVTIRPQSAQPISSGPTLPTSSDRHLKHLALLESVAQELSTATPGPTFRPLPHPGPPSSVPPLSFGQSTSVPLMQSSGSLNLPPFSATGRPGPPFPDDPFTVRPMTNQALFPPLPIVSRHAPNMSMHQGSLLSILKGFNGPSPNGPGSSHRTHLSGAMSGQGPLPYAHGYAHQPPFVPLASAPPPLRVAPPPPGPFHLHSGPLTAPLPPASGQPQFTFPQVGLNTPFNVHKPTPPNAAQLLTLLNSNTRARTTSMLVPDAIRPNFPADSSAAPSH